MMRLVRTLAYLRREQILGRIWFRCWRPRPSLDPAPELRALSGLWVVPARRTASLFGPDRARFLNEERDIGAASAWNDPGCDKLWLYNLHYFDDLNAGAAAERADWHRNLIRRWVAENPPGQGTGWEPYPTSLRIVNWIKWALSGHALEEAWRYSLAVQARWLTQRLEWHLLGNHLFANAKALVFAGCFFEGTEAESWLAQGLKILEREVPEQILADGGQFERSPMYHALALEDVLDLINLLRTFPRAVPERWRGLVAGFPDVSGRMRRWLAVMCHPDGEIGLFNDAAIGIAPAPAELEAYAARLGLSSSAPLRDGVIHLAESGYVRVQRDELVALLDLAPIGPDYLPGHAHADTLSFEMSLYGRRVLVNSGTSCYGSGPERQRQRGTAAHNTVVIDGADSSEVWGGFRVARRARPFDVKIAEQGGEIFVSGAHDGYRRLPGRPVHRREWRFTGKSLTISDIVEGRCRDAVARYFLHPDLRVKSDQHLGLSGIGIELGWTVWGGASEVIPSTFHPQFGASVSSHCLRVPLAGAKNKVVWTWS